MSDIVDSPHSIQHKGNVTGIGTLEALPLGNSCRRALFLFIFWKNNIYPIPTKQSVPNHFLQSSHQHNHQAITTIYTSVIVNIGRAINSSNFIIGVENMTDLK